MTDLEILRWLFSAALVLWLWAGWRFARRYFTTLTRVGFTYPFITAGVWLAVSNTLEAALYWYIVWLAPHNRALSRIALFVIPGAIATQAIAYMMVAHWAMKDLPAEELESGILRQEE